MVVPPIVPTLAGPPEDGNKQARLPSIWCGKVYQGACLEQLHGGGTEVGEAAHQRIELLRPGCPHPCQRLQPDLPWSNSEQHSSYNEAGIKSSMVPGPDDERVNLVSNELQRPRTCSSLWRGAIGRRSTQRST